MERDSLRGLLGHAKLFADSAPAGIMEDVSINSAVLLERILAEFAETNESQEIRNAGLLCERLLSEFGIAIPAEEIPELRDFETLARKVGARLERDEADQTIVHVFAQLEQIARDELHNSVQLRWFAKWVEYESLGNWLTRPDWLDYVELFMRIKEDLGVDFGVTKKSLETMPETVGETVKGIWQRSQPPATR